MYITGIETTKVTSAQEFALGTIGMNQDGKVWKYVEIKNTTATVAGVAGDCVSYAVDAGYNISRVVSDVTDAAAAPVGAGLLGGTIVGTLAVAEYGWIQIGGRAIANAAIGGTPADGDQLMASTTDKALTRQLYSGTTPNIIAIGASVAIGTDVSAKHVACQFAY